MHCHQLAVLTCHQLVVLTQDAAQAPYTCGQQASQGPAQLDAAGVRPLHRQGDGQAAHQLVATDAAPLAVQPVAGQAEAAAPPQLAGEQQGHPGVLLAGTARPLPSPAPSPAEAGAGCQAWRGPPGLHLLRHPPGLCLLGWGSHAPAAAQAAAGGPQCYSQGLRQGQESPRSTRPHDLVAGEKAVMPVPAQDQH